MEDQILTRMGIPKVGPLGALLRNLSETSSQNKLPAINKTKTAEGPEGQIK